MDRMMTLSPRRRPAAWMALLGLSLSGCHPPAPAAAPEPLRAVRVARIEARTLRVPVLASGLLTPREEAAVTSELSGYRVARVFVDQGAWVTAGQPMVQLDDTLLRAQIAAQRVAVERAERQAARVDDLDGKAVLSQEDIDARRFDARAARAALQDLETRQARMLLRAPVSGLVLKRNVRPGELSGGGVEPMFRLARDGQIEMAAEAPEAVLHGLRPGQSVAITLPGGERVVGTVRLIDPEIDPQTKLGVARVTLPKRQGQRPGGYAQAQFEGVGAPALVAPAKAITYDADGTSVMALDTRDVVSRVAVRIGARAGDHVQLLQGPPAGTRVLMSGTATVLAGDKVAIAQDLQAGAAR
ncbi:efflux RND transporter periplasmic adaptor subunit [Caulobacter segnis]|uniref:Efflux transporter, RND family, MFP subunit n=2 Tax=Caulobacter segnis TaxID=88688 RepID=D5VLS2_CAUST|nr:efflux RND transporter periplasmic adaptor subunit [Caulobacter segnis]ADG11445.1 efflux transporter, RND family, MFP subunit [Caulobacter segnis ATCC 21756]AVQ03108.1 efflux RND transporter periplasmic adaptor subunit [Caulobacter segnis]